MKLKEYITVTNVYCVLWVIGLLDELYLELTKMIVPYFALILVFGIVKYPEMKKLEKSSKIQ